MARRVNTRFVVFLGGILILGIGVLLGALWYFRYLDKDPARNVARAQEAEKRGDTMEALRLYMKACTEAAKIHRPGTDELLTRTGDLSMAASASAPNASTGEDLYRQAIGCWTKAVEQNPRYLLAHEKLIEERYKTSMFIRQAANWADLANDAKRLIEVDPNYANGYTYLATAKLELAKLTSTKQQLDPTVLVEVEDAVKKAMEKDPTSSKPVVVRAQLQGFQAVLATQAGLPKDAQEDIEAAAKGLNEYLAKHPNDTDATDVLARVYLGQRKPDDAVKLLVDTLAVNPGDGRLGDLLSQIYIGLNQTDKAEQLLKNQVTLNPADPDAYLRLARFYQSLLKTNEAIQAFKDVLAHPGQGGGIVLWQNRYREGTSLFSISWLYMDAAERAKGGVAGTEGAELMAQSDVYSGKLRASAQTDRSTLELLDGRTQLIKNNLDEAIKYLKRADAWYDSQPATMQWPHVKNLLAVAYNRKREWGLELQYLDQYLKVNPHHPGFLLRKGRNLAQVARYSESLAVIDEILHPKGELRLPAEMILDAKRVQAADYKGVGKMEEYETLMQEIARDSGGPDAEIALATNFLSTGELDKSRDIIDKVLEKDPANEKALALGVMIRLRQGPEHKADAAAMLKVALEKYPKNAQFQFLKGRMESSETDPIQLQIDASKFITDDYARNIFLAQVYLSKDDRSSALDAFGNAATALEKNGADESRDQLTRLSDQAFTLALGTVADARRQAADAEAAASRATTPDAKNAALANKAKAEELEKKSLEQAQLYAQKADRLNLDGVNGKLFQGRLLFAQAATRDQGLNILEQTAAAQPDNTNAHTILGGAYYDLNRVDDGINEFQTAISQKPDNMLALIRVIDLLIRKWEEKGDPNSIQKAQRYLEDALKFPFAKENAQLKQFNDRIGNVNDAIRTREALHQRDPNDDDNTYRLAGLYDRRAHEGRDRQADAARAVELLRPLFDKHKDNVPMGQHLARLYRDLQKYEDGKSVFETLLTAGDPLVHYDTLLAYGDYSASIGMYDYALSLYRDAAAHEPAGREGAIARIGELQFDLENMAGAETAYQQLVEQKHDARTQRRYAEVLINLQKFDLAQAQLDDIFKKNPKDVDARIVAAYMLIKQGKFAPSIDAFNAILKEHPNNYDALHYRALAQFAGQGDLKQAIDDLLTIRGKSDELLQSGRGALVVNSRLLLARVYRVSRKYAESAEEYDDIIKTLNPNVVSIRIEYARFLLVLSDVFYHIQPENTDEFAANIRVVKPVERMIALLDDSKKKIPAQPIWLMLEGQLLSLNPRLITQAQQRFEEAFRLSNGAIEPAVLLLNSMITTKDYQKVADLASALIANPPKDKPPYGDYFVKRGIAYAYQGKTNESLADFHQAMTLASQDLGLYVAVVQQAVAALKEIMTADLQSRIAAQPSDYFAKVALAQVLMTQGQGGEAVKLLTPVVSQVKNGERDFALRMMAMCKYQAKDFAGASKDYRELLKIKTDDIKGYQDAHSEDVEALNNFAFMLADDLKKPQEALVLAEKAVKLLKTGAVDVAFVNNGNIYDTYGWIKFLAGDVEGAIFQLQQAVQIEPLPVAYLHLAKALAQNGQKQEAQKSLAMGIKLAREKNDPVLKDLESAQQELNR